MKFKILDKVELFKSFLSIDKYTLQQDGLVKPFEREVMKRGSSAAILVYDDKRDLCLVVREFRIGFLAAGYDGRDAFSLSPIAGVVDPGEDPLEAALREAREEAGIVIEEHDVVSDTVILPSPGGSSEVVHLFIALRDLGDVKEGQFGNPNEGELTERVLLPRQYLLDMVDFKVVSGHLAQLVLRVEVNRLTGLVSEVDPDLVARNPDRFREDTQDLEGPDK